MSNQSQPSLPDEILEYVFELCAQDASSALTLPPTSLSLVSKGFNRLYTQTQFQSVHLHSQSQSLKLATLLSSRPICGQYIRYLTLDSPFAALSQLAPLLSKLRPLDILDIHLDGRKECRPHCRPLQTSNVEIELFCTALCQIHDVKRLVVRKGGYLTSSVNRILLALSVAVNKWNSLESVDLQYKHSSPQLGLSFRPTISFSQSPIPRDSLADALSRVPRLRVVRTHMPSIWNPFLHTVSRNPNLDRVEFVDPASTGTIPAITRRHSQDTGGRNVANETKFGQLVPVKSSATVAGGCLKGDVVSEVMASSLFMMEAAKHPRLHELIIKGRQHMFLEQMRLSSSSIERHAFDGYSSMPPRFRASLPGLCDLRLVSDVASKVHLRDSESLFKLLTGFINSERAHRARGQPIN
ncbi:hypothetical protein BD410DRAFT_829789 [Rickenella mellea]|uniref:F-box domain-containing protein n=1 Tax=Rickenella mellea TaxID=50990 RepID=A0A4Y7PYV6_9AGAM|nr:hypothetical protein BD410DRAFT_829789 [Rickenella mellea]